MKFRDAWTKRVEAMDRAAKLRKATPAEKAKIADEWNGTTRDLVDGGVVTETKPTVGAKYRNVKTDGYASKKEAQRAFELKLMQEAGQIRNLREQVEYELIPKQVGERACKYFSDFNYEEFTADGWRFVCEDTKGVRTHEYVIKRKLLLWVHGIKITET